MVEEKTGIGYPLMHTPLREEHFCPGRKDGAANDAK
jgi:hypothetical protein